MPPPQCFHATHPVPSRYDHAAITRLDGCDTIRSLKAMGWLKTAVVGNWKHRNTATLFLHSDPTRERGDGLPPSFFDAGRPGTITPCAMSLATHGLSSISLDPSRLQLLSLTPAIMAEVLKTVDKARTQERGGFTDISAVISEVGIDPNSVRVLFAAFTQALLAANVPCDCRCDFPAEARLLPLPGETFPELFLRSFKATSTYMFEEPIPSREPSPLPEPIEVGEESPAEEEEESAAAFAKRTPSPVHTPSASFTNPILLQLFNKAVTGASSAQYIDGRTFITLVVTTITKITLFSELQIWSDTILEALAMFDFRDSMEYATGEHGPFNRSCIKVQQVKSRVEVLRLDAIKRGDTLNALQVMQCLSSIPSLKKKVDALRARLDEEQATPKANRKFQSFSKRSSEGDPLDDLSEEQLSAVDGRVRRGMSKAQKTSEAAMVKLMEGLTKSIGSVVRKDYTPKKPGSPKKDYGMGTGFNALMTIIKGKSPSSTLPQQRAATKSIIANKCGLCLGQTEQTEEARPGKPPRFSCKADCKGTALHPTLIRAANALKSV